MRTMTNAQMRWNVQHGFAWALTPWEEHEFTHPIYTAAGAWYWDTAAQRYELCR